MALKAAGPASAIKGPHDLVTAIECLWPSIHLLVVGDLMLDQYIWGEVERISPEAPIPVVSVSRRTEQPGGAANVAMNAAGLGAQVSLAGFIGDDIEGRLLEAKLEAAGIHTKLVVTTGRPTTTKTRILGGRQQMLRLDVESAGSAAAESCDQLLARVLDVLRQPDCTVKAIVLSDYAKGVLNEKVCRAIIDRARELEVPVIVDPKGRDYSRYRAATMLCPNLAELALATGTIPADIDAVYAAGERLIGQLGLEKLVVTLSERGIMVLDGTTREAAPARARQVFDVSGAGDTVTAILALCLASAIEPMASVRLANIAAGIVVGKTGTSPVYRDELIAALTGGTPRSSGKVLDLEQMARQVEAWRAAGDRIVFTNGCFDLLHAGHLTLLEEARRRGDRLIVGLNSDASIHILKGWSRPLNGEAQRARLLAALAAVDGVVVFEEETPLRSILSLRPDVLVKGSEYAGEDIVGAVEVESWGGQVALVPMIAGTSTTLMLARALARSASSVA